LIAKWISKNNHRPDIRDQISETRYQRPDIRDQRAEGRGNCKKIRSLEDEKD